MKGSERKDQDLKVCKQSGRNQQEQKKARQLFFNFFFKFYFFNEVLLPSAPVMFTLQSSYLGESHIHLKGSDTVKHYILNDIGLENNVS